jgi:hypothetical protein
MMKTTSFSCFAKLPPELRRMIWRYSLSGPRYLPYDKWQMGPVALETNIEARHIALEHYQKRDHPGCGYIDFATDFIVETTADLLDRLRAPIIKYIRKNNQNVHNIMILHQWKPGRLAVDLFEQVFLALLKYSDLNHFVLTVCGSPVDLEELQFQRMVEQEKEDTDSNSMAYRVIDFVSRWLASESTTGTVQYCSKIKAEQELGLGFMECLEAGHLIARRIFCS